MKIETSFLLIFLSGVLLKFIPVTGGNIITVFSLFILICLYIFGAFYLFSYQKIKNRNLTFSILAGIFLSMPLLGILYKIMYWPGSKGMIQTGAIVTFVFIILAIRNYMKFKGTELKNYYRNMIIRCSVIISLVILMTIIPTNSLIRFQYRDDPEMARLLIRVVENPMNLQYRQEYMDYKISKDPNFQKN